jgi:hypothetical protein
LGSRVRVRGLVRLLLGAADALHRSAHACEGLLVLLDE